MRILKQTTLFVVLLAGLFLAGVQRSSAVTSVVVALRGEILGRCATDGGTTSIDLGDLHDGGVRRLPISVRCNTPFSVTVVSDQGALVTGDAGLAPPGFTGRIPYLASFEIPTDRGPLVGSCDSRDAARASCPSADSKGGIALSGSGQVEISWSKPEALPLAGHYRDRLSISFQPRI